LTGWACEAIAATTGKPCGTRAYARVIVTHPDGATSTGTWCGNHQRDLKRAGCELELVEKWSRSAS
jgi:hypothetical protein